jgi:hypothetical protein
MISFVQFIAEKFKPEIRAEELAKKHNVKLSVIKRALAKGIKVEKEHTTDIKTARTIASHHIDEMLDYYDRLARMERGKK